MKIKHLSKPHLGWIFYDVANSSYATSILSVIFSVYLATVLIPKEGLAIFGTVIPGESVWGYLIASVMVVVMLVSPVMGAKADATNSKKAYLVGWTGLGVVGTMFLFGATPDRLGLALVSVFVATVAYEMALVFYNAFLNDIVEPEKKGALSGYGFAGGYIGGGLCLAFNLYLISVFKEEGSTFAYRLSFFVVGVWWLLFSLPTYLWLKEKENVGREKKSSHSLVGQLKTTLLFAIQNKNIGRFLLAYIFYNDGIQTIILMASIFGAKELGMSATQLGLCFLLIQFVAFFGASFFGPLADRWGHKKTLTVTLVIYIAVTLWAIFLSTQFEFWILGVVIGVILGGSQSVSRSFYAKLIPAERSSELFAFYSVVGKAAALLGPLVFAIFSQGFGIRTGVGSLLMFFICGLGLLWFVEEEKSSMTQSPSRE